MLIIFNVCDERVKLLSALYPNERQQQNKEGRTKAVSGNDLWPIINRGVPRLAFVKIKIN